MRIAFYAPLKAPDHPVPSGDRTVARLLIRALRTAGHEVAIASRLRSYDGAGDRLRQQRLERTAKGQAADYAERHRADPPDLWFTYHLYHKAPDWIGPTVSKVLGIPYLVAEASYAPKQEGGPWALGHRAVEHALRAASQIVCLNPTDAECIGKLLGDGSGIRLLAPFTDTRPARRMAADREAQRRALAGMLGVDAAANWIAATAMMRPGDKLASYRLLGEALRRLPDRRWVLLVAGDGEARKEVEQALDFPGRVAYLGRLGRKDLDRLHAASDFGAWPAVNEAYGMALLEAQSAGLPLVTGNRPGVARIVRHGKTGLLTGEGDAEAFAAAVTCLLDSPELRESMRQEALRVTAGDHDLQGAALNLDRILHVAAEMQREGP